MTLPRADIALPEAHAARRAFDRAATTFDSACVIDDEARERLLERLEILALAPTTIVDLGAATGRSSRALQERYPAAHVVSVDWSLPMLRAARASGTASVLAADARQLPFADASVSLVFANMVLPWCRPEYLFSEAARVLVDRGLLCFATLGPDTLEQVRRAWAKTDDGIHVHALVDMHDLGDLAGMAGLIEPILDSSHIDVTYPDTAALMADLRALGATNVAAGRRRGLTGTRQWTAFEQRLAEGVRDGRLPVTVELVLGQAWGRGKRQVQPKFV